jgi:hypothetical protein
VSKETERAAISEHFKSVAEPEFGENIAWPNQAFETPQDTMFAVFNIVDRGTIRRSLGRSFTKRSFGTMQVDIYTPKNEGTKESRTLADIWSLVYEMLELTTSDGELIVFQTPSSRAMATNEIRAANLDDNWDRYVFEAPFYRDQNVEK